MDLLTLEQALAGEELLVYSRNLALPNNYLQDLLFPAQETSELTIDVIREGSRLPVMAQIAELGTQVKYGSREGMSGQRIEIPKIQRGRAMNEKLVRILLQSMLRPDEYTQIRNEQLGDARYLIDGIKARKEWVVMQSISTGKVEYVEDNTHISVDFGFASDQKPVLSGTDKWSDTENSNPLADIQEWVDNMSDKGIILTRALASRRIITLLLQNKKMREAYFGGRGLTTNPPELDRKQLDAIFEARGLPRIATYDTQARTEGNGLSGDRVAFSTERMMPQDRFVMLPDGPLGNYLWAKTTEEMAGDIKAEATDSNGIYVFREFNSHPIRLETIGVNLAFPCFPFADSIVSATVI